MQNIKSKLYNNLIKNNQPIKLYCIFLLSAFLCKIFILIAQIYYPIFKWQDYDIFSDSFSLVSSNYWGTIFKIFSLLAVPLLMTFILSFYYNLFKEKNLKYLFLFLALSLFQYSLLRGPLAIMYIFEYGVVPTNKELWITVFGILIIVIFFFLKMLKFDILKNQEINQEKTKKFVTNYLPFILSIHLFIAFLISYDYSDLFIDFLSFDLPLFIIFTISTWFTIKFLYDKKLFLTKLILSLPVLVIIDYFLYIGIYEVVSLLSSF